LGVWGGVVWVFRQWWCVVVGWGCAWLFGSQRGLWLCLMGVDRLVSVNGW